jgi:hypothetical protein
MKRREIMSIWRGLSAGFRSAHSAFLMLLLALLGLGDSFKSTVRKHHPADLARWLNSNASLRVFTPSARHATIAAKARGRSVGHAQGRQGKAPTSQASAQGQSATARMKAFFRPT